MRYKSSWESFVHPEPESRFAADSEIKEMFETVDLTQEKYPASGIPLHVAGDNVIVNNETEHHIIWGETASKKTRALIRPLIMTLIGAGESLIVSDVKGELSTQPQIIGHLTDKCYNIVYMDFKDFSGDGYNILEFPFKLYCQNQKSKAMSLVASLINALSRKYTKSDRDPFWHIMGEQYVIAVISILFEVFCQHPDYHKYVNIFTIASYCDDTGISRLSEIFNNYLLDVSNPSMTMLRGVLAAPERTRASIVAVAAGMFKDFIINDALLTMLSNSTFDIKSIYSKPTCIFLIIPDEHSTYDCIAGLMIDAFYSSIIETFSKEFQNKKPPKCRINWVCDEFCNLAVNDMRAKISASRSRDMRWFLVCQSKRQLEDVTGIDAATILGNCKNTWFLKSSDVKMLEYISDACGKTCVTEKDEDEPIISVEKLKTLKKEWTFIECIYLRDNTKYRAILPDINEYKHLEKYADFIIPNCSKLENCTVEAYEPHILLNEMKNGLIMIPFCGTYVRQGPEPINELTDEW